MKAAQILERLRPLVLVIDSLGYVCDVHGGFGGFLGLPTTNLVGTSVFDHVAPAEIDDLAHYFVESGGEQARSESLSLPFRVNLVGGDGRLHAVDVIPTGFQPDDDGWRWIVLIVPVVLNTAISRSLEAEMAGATRRRVRELLTEELAVDNDSYISRWFYIDLVGSKNPSVTGPPAETAPMAELLTRELAEHHWQPWAAAGRGQAIPVAVDDLPNSIADMARMKNWRRVTAAPVHLDGEVVAAYMLFGCVPDDFDVDVIKANVSARISGLVDITALLIARWRERDRLTMAATSDSLTGLANRDAFSDALAQVTAESALLYIDIDHFKAVNDHHGHEVGDHVLKEVADRIVAACRPNDVVARFGGDEFVVLLGGSGQAQARAIGARIVEMVSAPMSVAGATETINVSIGLAAVAGNDDDVISAADRAMLQAKRGGRARLVSAQFLR